MHTRLLLKIFISCPFLPVFNTCQLKTYFAPDILFISLQAHTVRGTGVLQQYIDKQQLPTELDGDYSHCHSDWLAFRLVTHCCVFSFYIK